MNVVYLITNEYLESKRIYIIGKAKDLKVRLSTYNKSIEHKVIYYKSFKSEKHMEKAETTILEVLDEFREQANRDRFILPVGQPIDFFTKKFDTIHELFYF